MNLIRRLGAFDMKKLIGLFSGLLLTFSSGIALAEASKIAVVDLQKIIDSKRNKVNGSVKLKLYKGNITIHSRQTKSKAYSMKKVSFEENKTFNKSNVEKFINFHKEKLK